MEGVAKSGSSGLTEYVARSSLVLAVSKSHDLPYSLRGSCSNCVLECLIQCYLIAHNCALDVDLKLLNYLATSFLYETPGFNFAIKELKQIKTWLDRRRLAFSAEAHAYGLPHPRGVLLVGPQGTGKSLTAKAIAHSWGMPLLRLDLGRLFAGLVGASEARTRDMIGTAEAMAPCILWIDEIDKGFSLDGRSDGGTGQRVLATLLTWMAEKDTPVFVMATANAIDQLPPELLRKGRFDEIFVLDLPDGSERRDILELHLRKRRPQHQLPLETLVDRTAGFSGAELEQVVLEGMLQAFSEGREFAEPDLISAAADLVPLSRTAREQLEALQQWAREGRARPAR